MKKENLSELERFQAEKEEFQSEMKKWTKHIRYEQDRLKQEKSLLDMKFKILESEFASLAKEKEALKKEREELKNQKIYTNGDFYQEQAFFFKGVTSPLGLKKRYKDLIKIFHPDNLFGDTETITKINLEYEKMKEYLQVRKKA